MKRLEIAGMRYICKILMNINITTRALVLPLLLGILLLSSCVSNRKVTLLQKNDVNTSGKSLPKDTVVRTYAVDTFQYKIQPNDILSVRFQSLTEKDFDVFNTGDGNMAINPMIGGALLFGELVDEHGQVEFPAIGRVQFRLG